MRTMMILFDGRFHNSLKPFTWTRPVADLRIGIQTIAEKWRDIFETPVSFLTQDYLQQKYPISKSKEYTYINAGVLPNSQLIQAIQKLAHNQILKCKNEIIAFKYAGVIAESNFEKLTLSFKILEFETQFLDFPETFIQLNAQEIKHDFLRLTPTQVNASVSSTNTVLGNLLFVENDVYAECCTFNTQNGPIHIGKNAQIMEGSHLRGPISIGAGSIVKMGSKIYGGTTIGPDCTVGGEIKNSIFWGNSNKGHDGYIGDSMIGEWCNFGAGTSNSNMKNNLNVVKIWSYETQKYRSTQLIFCGLMMGDHSKSAINTTFNTGTVVGICANVIFNQLTPTFIPDFSWKNEVYDLEKALKTIKNTFNRKNIEFDSVNKLIFIHIFNETNKSKLNQNNNIENEKKNCRR